MNRTWLRGGIVMMLACLSLLAAGAARAAAPAVCAGWNAMTPQPGVAMPGMEMPSMDMPGMYMLDASTGPLPLVCLTANDPEPPPLYGKIGDVSFPVPDGTKPAGAVTQSYFNQGLRFYYGFNNRESYRAFRYAIKQAPADAPCAICYVGEALALGVDINMQTELNPDRDAARQALTLGKSALAADIVNKKVTAHQIIFINAMLSALSRRFEDCPATAADCQNLRNKAYAAAMEQALPALTGDPVFAVLFADAVMNVWPWSYWNADGTPKGPEVVAAQVALENAMKDYPRDEGPPHWYIHLMEMSGHPDWARAAADTLGLLAPNAGHLVHMPSHIYYRLGDMPMAMKVNQQAIAVDEAYFRNEALSHPDGDRYRYGYYPHDIHFLIAAASLAGDRVAVGWAADRLLKSAPDEGNGFRADRYRAVYYLGRASFASAAEIRSFPAPLAGQPLALVAYDYAQLWASVLAGDSVRAKQDQTALNAAVASYPKAAGSEGKSCTTTGPLPRDINLCLIAIMINLGQARVAGLHGAWPAAASAALAAVTIQDRLPYDEPPPWLYPVRQSLAGLAVTLYDQGKVTKSDLLAVQTELRKALPSAQPAGQPIGAGIFPGDGWTYYALWQIDRRLGLPEAQDKANYGKTWLFPATPPDFGHM